MNLNKNQLSKIKKIQLQSIKKNKELNFAICGDNVFSINSKKNTNNNAKISNKDFHKVLKKCKNNDVFISHTHGLNSYQPSNIDYNTNKEFIFSNGFCTSGMNNLSCYDQNNQNIFLTEISSSFDYDFKKKGGKIYMGKELVCEKHNSCFLNNVNIGKYNNINSEGLNMHNDDNLLVISNKNHDMKCYDDLKHNIFCTDTE